VAHSRPFLKKADVLLAMVGFVRLCWNRLCQQDLTNVLATLLAAKRRMNCHWCTQSGRFRPYQIADTGGRLGFSSGLRVESRLGSGAPLPIMIRRSDLQEGGIVGGRRSVLVRAVFVFRQRYLVDALPQRGG